MCDHIDDERRSELTRATRLLDYGDPTLARLIAERGWRAMPESARIGAIYDFVRNEIAFGYNRDDNIPASAVLADGYGQCNTKATLLMALLRGAQIACRLHGFTVDKALQRGVVPELVYGLAPDEVVHSWVEIHHGGRWINLEGFILDDRYLEALQALFGGRGAGLCGYGVGTDDLDCPPVRWRGGDTYIQSTAIVRDFGWYDTPDEFFSGHSQAMGPARRLLYRLVISHWMNLRLGRMRRGHRYGRPWKQQDAPDLRIRSFEPRPPALSIEPVDTGKAV